MPSSLAFLARDVDRAVRRAGQRLVLAESCTAGLIAQSLSLVPGVSDWLCGSAVTYRNGTKTAWLGVDPVLLADPARGPVSAEAAAAMCAGALAKTPEATLAAAVTGHLGPHAPAELDGRVYIGVQQRSGDGKQHPADVTKHLLSSDAGGNTSDGESLRSLRQQAAAALVLQEVLRVLSIDTADDPSCPLHGN